MYRVLEIKDEDGCYLEGEVTKQEEILLRVIDEEDRAGVVILSRKQALGLVRWLADQGISLAPEVERIEKLEQALKLARHRILYSSHGADDEIHEKACDLDTLNAIDAILSPDLRSSGS